MTCNGIDIELSEHSNDGTIYGNFEGFLLGDWLGWLVGLELCTNGRYEPGFWYGRAIDTILGDMDGIPLGTCDGTLIGSLEGLINGTVAGKFEIFKASTIWTHSPEFTDFGIKWSK